MPSIEDGAFGLPSAKRQKRVTEKAVSKAPQPVGSRLFSPFRVSFFFFFLSIVVHYVS